ncbi:MAG: cytochrome ubiquinol oxidase subunit I, partial [Gammaproteobacteria bacterium]
ERDAPLHLVAMPNEETESNDYAISIPKVGSLIAAGAFDKPIRGLKEWPPEERPPVAIVFWSFRVMVGMGMAMLFIGFVGTFLMLRKKLDHARWFLRCCLLALPAGFVAVITGWITAEVGRQPYVVYGLLRTADAVSPVTASAVGTSLIVFIFVYAIVFAAGAYYMVKLARKGPEGPPQPESGHPDGPVRGSALPLKRSNPAQA